jgi:hypothetical protein
MADPADLLISLFHQAGDQYNVEFLYRRPGAESEILPCRGIAVFDAATLTALRGELNPEKHGRLLRQALFNDPNLIQYFKDAKTNANGILRIRLQFDPNARKLLDLRWEMLRDLDDLGFLALQADRPFSRFHYTRDFSDYELRPKGRLRVLVAAANPLELSDPEGFELDSGLYEAGESETRKMILAPVRLEQEIPRIQGALAALKPDVLAQYPGSLGPASLENLRTQLRRGIDILYLVCHGALLADGDGKSESPHLLLEKADGHYDLIKGEALEEIIRDLSVWDRPRLVVLASCQSGGKGLAPGANDEEEERSYDRGALAAFGPRLVEAGIPAVIAMQDNIQMETNQLFMQAFFEELFSEAGEGRVDRAAAKARSQVGGRSDWWVPVLYLRLSGGRLWHEPGFYWAKDEKEFDLWNPIIDSINTHHCTPILGPWLMEPMLGSPSEIARKWVSQLQESDSVLGDLKQVAQYLSVNPDDLSQVAEYSFTKRGRAYPRNHLFDRLRKLLKQKYENELPGGTLDKKDLPEMFSAIGSHLDQRQKDNSYTILAKLPFKIYINASQDNLLEQALSDAGRPADVDYFRWSASLWNPDNRIFRKEYQPTEERPLVYHMFGCFSEPESLVLSEDDYFEYLMKMGNDENIPLVVRTAWRENSLLILGFHISDWNFRVLFRSILNRRRILDRQTFGAEENYKSVAVQVPPLDNVQQPEGLSDYLKTYFERLSFRVYLGRADSFLKTLWESWQGKKAD